MRHRGTCRRGQRHFREKMIEKSVPGDGSQRTRPYQRDTELRTREKTKNVARRCRPTVADSGCHPPLACARIASSMS